MEKIFYRKSDTKKTLTELCQDKIFLKGDESRAKVVELIDDYNSKIDSLTREVEHFIPEKIEEIPTQSKSVFSESPVTAQQYLNSVKASSRTKFFVTKKYGLTLRPKDEWENIFRKEGL